MKRQHRYWIALWRSDNKLDGHNEHPIGGTVGGPPGPQLFRTRRECLEMIRVRYGYIRTRPDLRAEPHGWKMPKAVRATLTVEWP